MNLSTDDLQRYGIMTYRGADPRTDIPADYPNRAVVLEKVFRLGVFAHGVVAAGDQTAWLLQNSNRPDGSLSFARADGNGPDWGFAPDGAGSLDNPACSDIPGPFYTASYYLYREGGKSINPVFQWSLPLAGENNRRIMVNGNVRTEFPGAGTKICNIQMIYTSATSQDGYFFRGLNFENILNGYAQGFGTTGNNIRSDGRPYWNRGPYEECISPQGCPWPYVLEPDDAAPIGKQLQRTQGNTRYEDCFNTPCSGWENENCFYYGWERNIQTNCCVPLLGSDRCWTTDPGHQAQPWGPSDYPNDPENYYYTSWDDNSFALVSRRVDYGDGALVKTTADTYVKGGWMNQVVYGSASSGGPYSLLDDDDMADPDASASVSGNSQYILQYINLGDSAAWLGRYLKVGCRPFWKWNMYRGGSVVPYYLQLATAGSKTCMGAGSYNDWAISSSNNPLDCAGFYAGSITYDTDYPDYHAPWRVHRMHDALNPDGRGWLHASVRFMRQNPGSDCVSPTTYYVTYYPLQTKLANAVDSHDPAYYAGTYLQVLYKVIPW
jgi:hypothetical protein